MRTETPGDADLQVAAAGEEREGGSIAAALHQRERCVVAALKIKTEMRFLWTSWGDTQNGVGSVGGGGVGGSGGIELQKRV